MEGEDEMDNRSLSSIPWLMFFLLLNDSFLCSLLPSFSSDESAAALGLEDVGGTALPPSLALSLESLSRVLSSWEEAMFCPQIKLKVRGCEGARVRKDFQAHLAPVHFGDREALAQEGKGLATSRSTMVTEGTLPSWRLGLPMVFVSYSEGWSKKVKKQNKRQNKRSAHMYIT